MTFNNDDLDDALEKVISIYFRIKHKAPNYTTTYLKRALVECMEDLTKRALYNYCIETQVDKHEVDEAYRTWVKEEAELKDSINMSIDTNNDRIIRIKEHMKKYNKEDN
tara:strand:+ start:822 stop:1148 length:327 start_codon:yes stop_codon:yes gene_type:complete